ncbi:unnamed protein product [Rhizoctonia solani]|uniref:F-box domain-containing protein n=1 Tax=Rhizoctonia solani TaxID=456999 RepID=A0A8H3HS90_9AGAM|nr:unnamed protein product [Rhizoctonia solani]
MPEISSVSSYPRNHSYNLAPINTLPPEILIRIFHLVLAQPCNLHLLVSNGEKYYSRCPDYLAQVCALWRRIVVPSCSLWCHIDLSLYYPCSEALVARAGAHAARAGELPLELHIAVDDNRSSEYNKILPLILRIAARVESLEFVLTGGFLGFHRRLFNLLLGQRPILTKLGIRSNGNYSNNFIVPDSYDRTRLEGHFWPLKLDSSEDELESSFAPLTVLHLRGVFPLWWSTAYHGLVDLRLMSTDKWSQIKEIELMTILMSSPGLRILHFGLAISHKTHTTTEVTPVYLQDLQVVKIFPDSAGGKNLLPDDVLRLLAPGAKPLRLSFADYYITDPFLVMELEQFFAQSRVTRFYTRAVFPPLSTLLRYSAQLEQVVLDDFASNSCDILPCPWVNVDGLASLPRLRSLHITRSALFERELRLLLECCPDGIVLNSCNVDHDNDNGRPALTTLTTMELSELFPTVRTTSHILYPSEDPTADWDILD